MSGFMDLIFKKDPFEDDEQEGKDVEKHEEPKNKVQSAIPVEHKPAMPVQYTAPEQTAQVPDTYAKVPFTGGLNQKIYDTIHKEVLEDQTPFSKFIELYNKMFKIIPNEQQCVAAVITSMGVEPAEILNSIKDRHMAALAKVNSEFVAELDTYIKDNITQKETDMKTISGTIEANTKKILDLQKQNEALSTKQKETYDLINENKYKLEQKKTYFNFAYNYENQVIEKWANLISTYSNFSKENIQ